MAEEKKNGTREKVLEERIKELEREVKKLRQRNMGLMELLNDWGINFNDKVVH